ncbi:hypothetical protein HRR83_008692 [Exophiala dermatitidis]|uniref:Uncharacterized protein n=1 Tax=Exophiala dermatitidis TaxID=5970 RepID=A0AAN6EUS2_EXODE|nr:hypothetical protein HRR73_008507 [Exophiala dermatitidis]KAJ4505693.1 hypothetical protein HRR74_008604 [Exophiala dermatitidis]KAJ4536380.1 hypothetical protein HRR77_007300 [Exophiala dermatitidis]KAJ4541091.1 hypothetical protein HRR76_004468 [Exophiala dermatitidis]KAJ4559298.1 hypothetical protein HRR79_008321 [Exophiala dermatitidis]
MTPSREMAIYEYWKGCFGFRPCHGRGRESCLRHSDAREHTVSKDGFDCIFPSSTNASNTTAAPLASGLTSQKWWYELLMSMQPSQQCRVDKVSDLFSIPQFLVSKFTLVLGLDQLFCQLLRGISRPIYQRSSEYRYATALWPT